MGKKKHLLMAKIYIKKKCLRSENFCKETGRNYFSGSKLSIIGKP